MYEPNVICTYQYYDPELSSEPVADHEYDQEMSEILYQTNFLQCLNMTEFDLDEINKKIKELYDIIPREIFEESALCLAQKHLMSNDIFMGFMLLFSYNYFYLTHSLISKFLISGEKSILIIKEKEN
jgi:hypothetical protein